jgi:hypothetical protein
MKSTFPFLAKAIVIGLLSMFIGACAKPYHLYVKYDLTPKHIGLEGKQVTLKIIDERDAEAIFTEKAQNEFDLWDGTFALYHTDKKPKGEVQTYDLPALLKEVMKKRLEAMGIQVMEGGMDEAPLFKLTLKIFLLDLKGRTWVSDISYEAKLTKDNKKIGREQVSGQAERIKIIGKGAGEKLIGDIFSDSINRLDLEKLFKNAGL